MFFLKQGHSPVPLTRPVLRERGARWTEPWTRGAGGWPCSAGRGHRGSQGAPGQKPRLPAASRHSPTPGPALLSPKGQRTLPRGAAGPGRAAGPEGRGGREAAEEGAAPRGRYGGGAGLPASRRRPPPRLPPPPFDNFPPPRTLGLPRWRRVPSVSPSQPPRRGSRTSAPPSGDPSGCACACALAPPAAAPPGSEPLRPLRGRHDDSGPAGRGRPGLARCAPSVLPLPARVTPGGLPPAPPCPPPRPPAAPGAAASESGFLPPFHAADAAERPGWAGLWALGPPRGLAPQKPEQHFPRRRAQYMFSEWREAPSWGFCGQEGPLRLGCEESGGSPRLSTPPAARHLLPGSSPPFPPS